MLSNIGKVISRTCMITNSLKYGSNYITNSRYQVAIGTKLLKEFQLSGTSVNKNAGETAASIIFKPSSIQINSIDLPNLQHKKPLNIMDLPVLPIPAFEMPSIKNNVIEKTDVESPAIPKQLPSQDNSTEKHAVTMLIIRRKKMKKHRRKKWLKKFKFVVEKMRLRKQQRREKEFQEKLAAQILKAEKFNAEEYVASRIRLAEQVVELYPKRQKLPPRFPFMNPV